MIPFNQVPGTNFHDVNLDWIINTVKAAVEDWTATKADWITTQEAWTETQEAWTELQTYVQNYFNTLDVSQEISAKIDAMAQDGSLLALIQDTVNQTAEAAAIDTTEAWLDEHITQETGYVLDSSLTLSNAAAPANKVGQISEQSPNMFYVTDPEDTTLSTGQVLTFQSPSRFSVSNAETSTGTKICCLGNETFVSGTFNANLDAGSYYVYIKKTGVTTTDCDFLYRTGSGTTGQTRISNGMLTVADDVEVYINLSGRVYSGSVEIMMIPMEEEPDTPPEYVDYGWSTAKDTIARADIINNAFASSAAAGNAALYAGLGLYNYKCYPQSFHCTQVAQIPTYAAYPSAAVNTTGCTSDGSRYLWISTRISDTLLVLRILDTFTGEFVKEGTVANVGHAQTMCYKEGEIFIASWLSGLPENPTEEQTAAYEDAYDSITVIDAYTYAVKRVIHLSDLIPEEVSYDKRVHGLAWSEQYGCFVCVTAQVTTASTWTTQEIILFLEDEVLESYQIADKTDKLPGVVDGCIVTPSYIIPMMGYKPAFFTWNDPPVNVSVGEYNNIQAYLHDAAAGYIWEAEAPMICNGAVYVSAMKIDESDSSVLGSYVFKITPYNFRFLS